MFYSKTACVAYKEGVPINLAKALNLSARQKEKNEILDRLGVDRSSFTDLFSACLGYGARVQEAGSKLIVKGRRRSVDFERGETLFGDDAPHAI